MNRDEFYTRLKNAPHPLIVDLWAPWCGPCRAMEPAFKQVSQVYQGQVDVLKINADEAPDVLKALGVMGIPTVIAFAKDREILRRSGMQTVELLNIMFEAALTQHKPDIIPPAPIDRLLRSGLGLFLVGFGWYSHTSWLLMGLGLVVIFSAFYDRCPVYRAVVPKLKTLFQKSG
jgi:thioredoxin